ncbi:MFS transporter [Candidatus Nitrososphaera sp. FF02]|uniref:MFS transporter n=1 Tax=Candidatus Nitrososphaera sp. FF02 TaxID=3398226 RepID=UPI0039EC312F
MAGVEKQQGATRSWWTTLIILSCLGLIVTFDETMILPAIPDFIRDFNISYSASSWLLSAYIIAAAVMTPIGGRLSDIYGKKKILLIVMAVYIIGVIAGRFAHNMEFMMVARALQGVGMTMFPIAFGIIREVIPEKKFAIGQTIFSSTFSGGAIVGLVGGAAIIQSFGWQATFLAVLPVAIGLWLTIVKFVRVPAPTPHPGMEVPPGPPDKSIDVKGVLALATTIIAFLTGITFLESGSDGAEFQAIGLFAASAASLAVFIAVEKRVRMPLLDLKLMKSRTFLPPTVILMLVFMSIFMVYLTIPIMVRSPEPLGFGGDAVAVASVQLPFMAVLLVGTVMSGFIVNKIKNTKLTLMGTIIAAAGFFILLMFHSTEATVSIGLTILAAGLSLAITGAFNVILLSVPMQMTGIALGMTLLLNLVGMSVGPALSGALQETYQGTVPGIEESFPTEAAYNLIFLSAAAVSLASVGMALIVARRKVAPTMTAGDPHGAGGR